VSNASGRELKILPGVYTDVVAHPGGGFIHARTDTDWRTVIVEHVTAGGHRLPLWRRVLPSRCLYLRVAVATSGDVVVVAQDGRDGTSPDGAFWIVTAAGEQSIDGYCHAPYGVVVEWRSDLGKFRVYATRRRDYAWFNLDRESPTPYLAGGAAHFGTSQGWLDVVDGGLFWSDLARTWPAGGDTKLVCPHTRAGVTVGQAPGDLHGMRAFGPGFESEITPEDAFEPRIAHDAMSGAYAVCARLLHERTAFQICPPWPPAAMDVPLPIPVPAPVPVPVPVPPSGGFMLTSDLVMSIDSSGLGKGATPLERRRAALAFSNAVALEANRRVGRTRFGLLAGYGAESDVDGYKADIVVDSETATHFDVVASSEGTKAAPTFIDNGPIDMSRFRLPLAAPSTPAPVPTPPASGVPVPPAPPAGGVTNEQLLAEIVYIRAKLEQHFR
jgi:hypothetical protein